MIGHVPDLLGDQDDVVRELGKVLDLAHTDIAATEDHYWPFDVKDSWQPHELPPPFGISKETFFSSLVENNSL